ncbi:hypothetical protein Q9233_012875 [Columba guinea]|nr:hypothetical protein Q9233_012875 [Columba guinea]
MMFFCNFVLWRHDKQKSTGVYLKKVQGSYRKETMKKIYVRELGNQAVLANGHDNLIEMDVFSPTYHDSSYGMCSIAEGSMGEPADYTGSFDPSSVQGIRFIDVIYPLVNQAELSNVKWQVRVMVSLTEPSSIQHE